MKAIKKLSMALLAAASVFTVASCSSDKRNTTVPMANLNTSDVIASIEGADMTVGEYYSRLRTAGYTTFYNEVKKALFKTEFDKAQSECVLTDDTVTETEQKIFDYVANGLYGSKDQETIEALTAEEKATAIQKYIDANNNKGIVITTEQCEAFTFVDGKIKFNNLPTAIIESQLVTIAVEDAAKAKLATIVDLEEIEDEDGKLITNTNHISEKNIQNYYESSVMSNGTYNAIIIQFNNLTEARNAIAAAKATLGEDITEANIAKFYAILYNAYYKHRTQLDVNNPFASEETKFLVNADEDQLTEISSSIKNFVVDTLEDGDALEQPFNLSNKYVMVYRHTTTYDLNVKYNVADKTNKIEWAKLKETVGETNYNEVRQEVKDELIDNKVSTYSNTIITDRIKDTEIEIYDPLFELQFSKTYADYELIDTKNFNNDLIFKLTYADNEYTYSVADFYEDQTATSGLNTIVDYLKLEYVTKYNDKFYDEDQIKEFEKAIDDAVEIFEKDENPSYPTSVGLETYLLSAYGYPTVAEAKKFTVAKNTLSKYLSQTVFDEWANEDHTINTDNINILNNMLNTGNKYYQDNNLFSINIDHLLIYIDDNSDGNPDDPAEFVEKLADKEDFNKELLALSQAIYAEANCKELTASNDLMEILNYIVKAYTRNEKLYSNPNATWKDYKKYNFILKVESLSSSGNTTESNVDSYVKEFADYVRALYKKAVADDLAVKDDNPIFYFTTSGNNAPATMEDICATQFGYHMIIVNDYSEPEGTDISQTSDTYGYLSNFEVLLNEKDKDTEDDNIYVVIEDVYNEKTNEVTLNQFFTYYVEKRMGATSTLNTNIQSLFNSIFGDSIALYTSSSFQTFLLVNDMDITMNDDALAARFTVFKNYLINTSKSYKTDDQFNSWYDGTLDWTRPYQK